MRRRNVAVAIAVAAVAALALASCTSASHPDGSAAATETVPSTAGQSGSQGSGTATAPESATDSGDVTSTSGPPPAPGEVGGSACGTPHGPYDAPAAAPSGTVTVAAGGLATSLNAGTGRGHTSRNIAPRYLLDGPGLFYDNDDNELVNNDSLGTCTLDSLDPLTVTYRLNPNATWSDGVPVSAADLVLSWAAGSGLFDAPSSRDDGAGDGSGDDAADGAADGAGDESGGDSDEAFAFDATNPGAALITSFPQIGDRGRSVTVTYSRYFTDYATVLDIGVPAHVVAMHALAGDSEDDAARATAEMMRLFADTVGDVADATADQRAELKAIAEFWNTGFDATSLPDDPSLAVSLGAYTLAAWKKDQYMMFRARDGVTWGPRAQVHTIRWVDAPDPVAAIASLGDGELDVIHPTSTPDVMAALADLTDPDIRVDTGAGAAYEHLDLVFDNGGPFDPASYDGDAAVARAVRKAFLLTVDRQQIVDDLIAPLNPDAAVRQTFVTMPGSPGYDALASTNGSEFYADGGSSSAIATAQQLLADAGVSTPVTVRLLYDADNSRRAKEYQMIAASAAKAGFDVIDGATDQWADLLPHNTLYDAGLFAWQSQSTGVTELAPNYQCKTDDTDWGVNNFGHYCNDDVNAALADLIHQPDSDHRQHDVENVEKALWADGFGLPLYQFPTVLAYDSATVTGVAGMALAPGFVWNFWQWKPGER